MTRGELAVLSEIILEEERRKARRYRCAIVILAAVGLVELLAS